MRYVNDVLNTFIGEDGGCLFVSAFELNKRDLDVVAEAEFYCDRIEKRYGTKDIYEMMKQDASNREVHDYLNARHDLMMLLGTDR